MERELVVDSCGMHAVGVWHDPDGEFVELAFWSTGERYSVWQRLSGAWAWLRGRPYHDMVVLNAEDVEALVTALVTDDMEG